MNNKQARAWGPPLLLLAIALVFGVGFITSSAFASARTNTTVPDPNIALDTNTLTATISPTRFPSPVCTPGGPYVYATATGSIVPATTDTGNHCDDCITTLPIPFQVRFFQVSRSSMIVSSNGILAFTTGATALSNTCLPFTSVSDAIFPYWDDLRTDNTAGAAGPAGIFTAVVGVAPNRIFYVEWRACLRTAVACTSVDTNFEVQMHENGDPFEIIYGPMAENGSGATIGTQRSTGGSVTQYSCNTPSLTAGTEIDWRPLACGEPFPTVTNTPLPTNTRTATGTATPTPCVSYNVTIGAGVIDPGTALLAGSQADDAVSPITFPFPVLLYGTSYTGASAGANGNIQFTSSSTEYLNACLPSALLNNAVLPLWDDLDMRPTVTTTFVPGIYTSLTGSAPNRLFNIEWRACIRDGGNCNKGAVNFEVTFDENSPNISYTYGTVQDGGATIGIQQNTGARFVQYSCNTTGINSGTRINFIPSLGCSTPTPTITHTATQTPTSTQTTTGTITATPTQICPNSWTTQNAYPRNIVDNAVASHGGLIYSFSGIASRLFTTASSKYDPATNAWSAIAPLPAARQKGSAVSDGTYIYILGGADSAANTTSTVYRYDPIANSYSTMAPYSAASWAQAAAYLNGKIYRIGGCDANCGSSLNSVEVYTIATNTWAPAAVLPASAGFLSATALNGFVYAAGGSVPLNSARTYRYDPSTNTWDDNAIADLPATRWGAASGVAGGKWIIAGGFTAGNISNTVISYDPATNLWTAIDPMPAPRARLEGAGTGAAFYAIGGRGPADVDPGDGHNDNQRYIDICGATATPTATGTPSSTNTPTPSNTATPDPSALGLVVHVTWQGRTAGTARYVVPVTMTLKSATGEYNFPAQNTDQQGFITFTISSVPAGTYDIRVKSHNKYYANCDTVTLPGSGTTQKDMGQMKAGDANGDNRVTSSDFGLLKNTLGKGCGEVGYDDRADFNGDCLVSTTDFNLLKNNIGLAGCSGL